MPYYQAMSDSVPAPTLIDLFAGAGGMSLGFVRRGFTPVFAVEWEKDAAATYVANFGDHCYAGAIQDVAVFPSVDVIIGGPPCQGFSPLGRDRDDDSRYEMNTLWTEYLRVVRQVRPLVFVIENVPEFLASGQYRTFLHVMASDPSLRDYVVDERVLNAADYGVPQRRRRGFVLASRIGPVEWPAKTHGPASEGAIPYATVCDAIGDLPFEPTNEDLHLGRNPTEMSLERYRAVPPGGNRFDLAANRPDLLPACWANKPTGTTDVFGRLWWDRPSVTIRTEFYKPEKGRYLHPEAHRPITHREAARIQTFPDDFEFEGSRIQIARQIGNAVPPLLAETIAKAVRSRLEQPEPNPITEKLFPAQLVLMLADVG
jgi:DNA (cytosine-5)-methyltransferase 1